MRLQNLLKVPLGLIFSMLPSQNKIRKNGITVFVYHEVTDTPSLFSEEYGLAVSTATFRKQIEWIKKNFTIIHPKQLSDNSKLSQYSALITFDDGMLSSFENGLRILEEMNVPSLFFLNMSSVVERSPLTSAVLCFLGKESFEFKEHCASNQVKPPYHLTVNPKILNNFFAKNTIKNDKVLVEYQGQFAELDLVKKWSISKNVIYANHLYEHWNAEALNDDEFVDQFVRNEEMLNQFNNTVKYFAFPNGQPGICFTNRHITLLKCLGVERIFYSSGNINANETNLQLDRISFGKYDHTSASMWFKVGFAYYKNRIQKIFS